MGVNAAVADQPDFYSVPLRVGRLMRIEINQPYDVAAMGVAEHRKELA